MKIHLCALIADNWSFCCLNTFFKSACLRGKGRRKFKLLKRGSDSINDNLDIINLLKMQADIKIFTSLLLTKS